MTKEDTKLEKMNIIMAFNYGVINSFEYLELMKNLNEVEYETENDAE